MAIDSKVSMTITEPSPAVSTETKTAHQGRLARMVGHIATQFVRAGQPTEQTLATSRTLHEGIRFSNQAFANSYDNLQQERDTSAYE